MSTAASQFGALPLPAPPPLQGETAGDPGLDVLLAFARAVIVASCGDVWATLAPGADSVVRVTKAHSPAEHTFVTSWCPALFGWRAGGEIETIADDYDVETSRITLLWVFLPTTNEKQGSRAPIANAIGKALDAALRRGRHPAWTQAGDTDTQAAARGSFLWSWAGWFAFDKAGWKPQELQVESESKQVRFPAVQWDLTVRELVTLGRSTDPNKLTATLEIPDGDAPLVTFALPLP